MYFWYKNIQQKQLIKLKKIYRHGSVMKFPKMSNFIFNIIKENKIFSENEKTEEKKNI